MHVRATESHFYGRLHAEMPTSGVKPGQTIPSANADEHPTFEKHISFYFAFKASDSLFLINVTF